MYLYAAHAEVHVSLCSVYFLPFLGAFLAAFLGDVWNQSKSSFNTH